MRRVNVTPLVFFSSPKTTIMASSVTCHRSLIKLSTLLRLTTLVSILTLLPMIHSSDVVPTSISPSRRATTAPAMPLGQAFVNNLQSTGARLYATGMMTAHAVALLLDITRNLRYMSRKRTGNVMARVSRRRPPIGPHHEPGRRQFKSLSKLF